MAAAPKLLLVYTKDPDLNRVQQNTAEAFRHLAASQGASDTAVMDITFTASDPGATTPIPVAFTAPSKPGLTVVGVEVIRPQNVSSPSTVFYEAVSPAGFTISGSIVSVAFFTGLDPGVTYKLTLRITYGEAG